MVNTFTIIPPFIALYIYLLLIKHINGLVGNDSNVFCSNHIFEKESNMSSNEINNLCKMIINDSRFIIKLDSSEFIDRKLYQRDSREFFISKCKELNLCYKGYGISLYHNNIRTLSISLGDLSSKQINQEQLDIIIAKSTRAIAIIDCITIAIREIEKIVPVQSDDMLPLRNDSLSEREDNQYNGKVNPIVILIIILIPFILIALLISLLFKYNSMDINDISPCVIHEYFTTLQVFYKEINANKSKIITMNKCILCFKVISPHLQKVFYEMDEIETEDTQLRNTTIIKPKLKPNEMPLLKKRSLDFSIDNINTRFSCGHVYHNECLLRIKRQQCLMCNDKKEHIAIANKINQQVIKESNIICLLYNFNQLYSQSELSRYNEVYSNELEEAKDLYAKRKLFQNS